MQHYLSLQGRSTQAEFKVRALERWMFKLPNRETGNHQLYNHLKHYLAPPKANSKRHILLDPLGFSHIGEGEIYGYR